MIFDLLICSNSSLCKFFIKLIDAINILEDCILGFIMLCLTSMLNGLSLMLLNHHLLVNRHLIEFHLGVFCCFDI